MPVTDWIARHDVEAITGPGRAAALQAARDAARNRLLAFIAGLVALGALVYTMRTFGLSREGQVTDRFTKAIGQLGDASPDVRVGAIYALEMIVRDSRRNHQAVMEFLAAFAREHSPAQVPASAEGEAVTDASEHIMRQDVQVAVAVIGRRNPRHDDRNKKVDLSDTDLAGAELADANLAHAHLARANLAGAHLGHAHLEGANLADANLEGAHLDHAHLGHAHLEGANLKGVHLKGAHLYRACLKRAHLKGAHLEGANLAWADLAGANLEGADFTSAHLGEADFHGANLKHAKLGKAKGLGAQWEGANLTDASWPKPPGLDEPTGWKCDPSGHLKKLPDNDPAAAARN